MVSLHGRHLERLLANIADALLNLECTLLHGIGEGADVEMLFLAGEEIRVDARLPCHIVVQHQAGNVGFKRFGVQA